MTDKQEITFDCKICNDDFDDETTDLIPRILTNCGHTICEKCANRLLSQSEIVCPFDRKITVLVGGQIQERKKCAESEYVPKSDDSETNEETCIENPCFQNSKHEAVFFCEQCDEDFCESCFISLHRPKPFAAHKKTLISEKPLKLPKCAEHPYNIADLWCKDSNCEVVEKRMCHTCLLAGEHKSHEYKLLIDQISSIVEKLDTKWEEAKEQIETYEVMNECLKNCLETFDDKNPLYLELVQTISNQFEVKKVNALEKLKRFSQDQQILLLTEMNNNSDRMSRLVKTRLEICKRMENRENLLEDPYENLLDNAFMLGNSIQYDLLEFNDYDYSLSDEMELNIMKRKE